MVVVQIGAGKGNDDVFEFVKKQKIDLLLLVEPNPLHIEDLNRCYRSLNNVIIENVALKPSRAKTLNEMYLYYSTHDGPGYESTSAYIEHLILSKFPRDSIKPIRCRCVDIHSLFKKHGISKVDYLFIDIEGMDLEIIKDVDFKNIDIKNIQFECIHINAVEAMRYLEKFGYWHINESIGDAYRDILMTKWT